MALGYYTDIRGARDCFRCQAGRVSLIYNATTCDYCPAGTFQTEGVLNITTPGEEGEEDEIDTIPNALLCVDCPPGAHSAAPRSTQCDLCPAGTMQPDPKSTTCLLCPPGAFSSEPGSREC